MRCLGRTFGCLLLALIVMIAPAAIWGVVIWNNLLTNVDEYTARLDEESYDDMTIFVIPVVAGIASPDPTDDSQDEKRAQIELFAETIINIDRNQWKSLIDGYISADWVQTVLNVNLRSIRRYLDFETDEVNIRADLTPVYNAISGDAGSALSDGVFAAVRQLDECNDRQSETIDKLLQGDPDPSVPRCRPTESQLDLMQNFFNAGRMHIVAELETLEDFQLDVRQQAIDNDSIEQFDRDAHDSRRGFFLIDRILPVILLAPVMLMALLVVISVRSAKGFFLWASFALIGSAFFTLLPLIPWIWGVIVDNPQDNSALTGSQDPAVELLVELQRVLLSAFTGPILSAVGLMAFIGIGFLLLAALLRGPQSNTQQQVYYVMPGQTGQFGSTGTPMPVIYQTPPGTPQPQPVQPMSPSEPTQVTPAPPAVPTQGSSAADIHKDALNRQDVADEHTFIPSDSQADKPE